MIALLLLFLVIGAAIGGGLVHCVHAGYFDPDPYDRLAELDRRRRA